MSQSRLLLLQWLAQGTIIAFVFALGACAGSFLNVVAYRLPRGLNIVSPPSACPACGKRLGLRENFPIFGWLLARGRCRGCGVKISPQYLLMELTVALLFTLLWFLWGVDARLLADGGIHLGAWRPEWAAESMKLMWPMFALGIVLVGALVTATLIDAQTFTIPAVIPWTVMAIAFVAHPVHAVFVARDGGLTASPFPWTIPAPAGGAGWIFVGAALGSLAGLAVANALLHWRVIPRSFADFEEWEREAEAALKTAHTDAETGEPRDDLSLPAEPSLKELLTRTLVLTGPAIAGMFLGTVLLSPAGQALTGLAVGGAAGLVVGAVLRSRLGATDTPAEGEPVWTQYPHARREMLKECLFLAPAALGLAAGAWVGLGQAGLAQDPVTGAVIATAGAPPLWLLALAASLMGAIIGGGLVWAVRILGSLAFGKEAMGLGDVHLMAGVGAVLGWIDPALAFFVAPFFGLAWAAAAPALGKLVRIPTVLPYGPHLALATLAVMYAKPGAERLLGLIAGGPVNLP